MKTTPKQRAELRRWAAKAKVSVFVGADVLTALLDDLDEALAERDTTARLLAAETAKVGELTAEVERLRTTIDDVVVVCDQTIDERDAARIKLYLIATELGLWQGGLADRLRTILGPDGPECTCPETDPGHRTVSYTVASSDLEPHACSCPRWGMKRATTFEVKS